MNHDFTIPDVDMGQLDVPVSRIFPFHTVCFQTVFTLALSLANRSGKRHAIETQSSRPSFGVRRIRPQKWSAGLVNRCTFTGSSYRYSETTRSFASFHHSSKLEEETWLVVGDGDLSYSVRLGQHLTSAAQIGSDLDETDHAANIRLIASVWEDQATHEAVYKNSRAHQDAINNLVDNKNQYVVWFGVDTTQLSTRFAPHSLDRIIFNFPHWKGKSSVRHNRQLLSDFFQSAAEVLRQPRNDSGGHVWVTLCQDQGGVEARTMSGWKSSWMIAVYAAQHGLVVRSILPWEDSPTNGIFSDYNLSSHRGADRPFDVGQRPLVYSLGWPCGTTAIIPRDAQIAIRHELRIRLDPGKLFTLGIDQDELSQGCVVPNLARSIVSKMTKGGIECELPMRSVIDATSSCGTTTSPIRLPPLLVFLVVYIGVYEPLTRALADQIRRQLDVAVEETLGLEVPRTGPDRMVSKPFPYHLLSKLLDERSAGRYGDDDPTHGLN